MVTFEHMVVAGLVFAALGIIFLLFSQPPPTDAPPAPVHVHADFAVYWNNVRVDFSKPQYVSSEDNPLHRGIHMHEIAGNVLHRHSQFATLGDFFQSLGMEMTNDCFRLDTSESFCNDNKTGATLKLYVNGELNSAMENYIFNDLDKILVTYGNEDETTIQQQFASLSDLACVQSNLCPEKGSPTPEDGCAVGTGVDCVA